MHEALQPLSSIGSFSSPVRSSLSHLRFKGSLMLRQVMKRRAFTLIELLVVIATRLRVA
jgi:hypothetical protein